MLNSRYVIDGVARKLTPAGMLGDEQGEVGVDVIVDETIDPEPGIPQIDASRVQEYLEMLSGEERLLPIPFAAEFTLSKLMQTVVDSIWKQGNVKLEDMPLTLKWTWNRDKVGNAAAFYSSVEAVSQYIEGLGGMVRRFSFEDGEPSFKASTPFSGAPSICPSQLCPDPSSWIVYVPFETSDYFLGGSLLSQTLQVGSGRAPQLSDPDYFMDCFELVRELVEDGIVVSGVGVGDGGLLPAVKSLCGNLGAKLNLSDIVPLAPDSDIVRACFAEVPGVVFQIRDEDFDYLDAECILQDIAYYPLGHPDEVNPALEINSDERGAINTILDSLLRR